MQQRQRPQPLVQKTLKSPPWQNRAPGRQMSSKLPSRHEQLKDASLTGSRSAAKTNMNKGGAKIMRKLLGQANPPANQVNENSNIDSPKLRPSASQSSTYHAGAPIACLDQSPDGQRAVIAGSKLFKIVKVDGPTIKEELDLRAIISSYANSRDLSAATPEQLNIKAVKWSHSSLDSTVITACGNGRMTVYDLNRGGDGFEVARIQEHARQVHKLAINPFKCNWLLSASQDTTVKSFDLRTPLASRNGHIFRTWHTFKGNAEAVRDVKWSPVDGMEFAICTESGQVQKWDVRKPGAPMLKLAAHQKCFSIDWHPDGDHLVSGGTDQLCHVWDLSKSADRNQKPRYTFATPAPVSTVSWRPACWSNTANGKRAAQITVSYDDSIVNKTQNSSVHIWDLARPSLPFKEIDQWETAPTGILWNTRDLLWAVDREGRFSQTDVAFSPKVIDRKPLSTFSFSPAGDILMLLEERQVPKRRARPSISSPDVSPRPDVSPSLPNSSISPLLGVSRSDSDEDVVGSFLGVRQKKKHRRRNSGRSTQSFSSTPPSTTGNAVMPLDDAVRITGIYKSQQVMAIGQAPSTVKRQTYEYFSNRYLSRLWKTSDAEVPSVDDKVKYITDAFAKAAERIGHYRLAQTWRVLGYSMNILLARRAEYHRQARLKAPEPTPKKEALKDQLATFDLNGPMRNGTETPRRRQRGDRTPRTRDRSRTPRIQTPRTHTPQDSPRHHPATKIITDDIESTSNVATPLVRPVRDHVAIIREAMHTPINIDDDVLDISETTLAETAPSPIPVPGAVQSDSRNSPSVDGYDFYGVDSVSPVVDFHVPPRKQPLRLDYPPQPNTQQTIFPGIQRHDSGESFQMFSTSGDSHQDKFLSSSIGETDHTLRERVHSWENSLPNHPRQRLDSEGLTEVTDTTDSSFEQDGSSSRSNSNLEAHGVPFRQTASPSPAIPPLLRLQEPSFQSVPNVTTVNPVEEIPYSPTATAKPPENPDIIPSDYLPLHNDPDFSIPALDATTLVSRSIGFECQSGSLHAAAMILLFVPLLPANAIDPILANAVIRQYHHRLTSLRLHTEAALLRNLATPAYPSVFAVAQENTTVAYFCTSCQKPLDNDPLIPNSVWKCPRCRGAIDACAICHHREFQPALSYSKDDVPTVTTLWHYCSGCGHGGHTACLSAWHGTSVISKQSGGCCPLEGCLHPCLPGPWRVQRGEERKVAKEKEMQSLIKENSRASGRGPVAMGRGVRRDRREVNQSKAVEGVRIALGVIPDRALERKKSVKLVAPGEEMK